MRSTLLFAIPLTLAVGVLTVARAKQNKPAEQGKKSTIVKIVKSDAEWRKILTPMAFRVMREKDTERAYSGQYWHSKQEGTYVCAGCDLELFSSKTTFDSGTAWPSSWHPVAKPHTAPNPHPAR